MSNIYQVVDDGNVRRWIFSDHMAGPSLAGSENFFLSQQCNVAHVFSQFARRSSHARQACATHSFARSHFSFTSYTSYTESAQQRKGAARTRRCTAVHQKPTPVPGKETGWRHVTSWKMGSSLFSRVGGHR